MKVCLPSNQCTVPENTKLLQDKRFNYLLCKLRPYMVFIKWKSMYPTKTAHHILNDEVDLILPKFHEGRKSKRGIFGTIILGFVGVAFEGISSFLHSRKHKALHKAVHAISAKTDIQRNKHMHLEDTLVMYGVYSAEALEKNL